MKIGIFNGPVCEVLREVVRLYDKATSLSVYDAECLGRTSSEVIDNLTEESQPTASSCFILELASQMLVAVVGSKTDKLYNGRH